MRTRDANKTPRTVVVRTPREGTGQFHSYEPPRVNNGNVPLKIAK